MKLVKHDGESAQLHLEQKELLMLMALVQEGRDSFGCTAQTGRELDALISHANMLVERARRDKLGISQLGHKMGTVVIPNTGTRKVAH